MKHWLKSIVKEYLTFSARERKGIVILAILTVIIVAAFRFYPVKKTAIKKDAFQQELAHLAITIDSSDKNRGFAENDNDHDYYQPKDYDNNKYKKGELFAFDPNTLNADGWKRLGVRDKTVQTIQKFIAKGFKFRRPEDIARIYGLSAEEVQRLMPYVRINEADDTQAGSYVEHTAASYPAKTEYSAAKARVIEINSADSSAFIALPGIGSKLAARIINFRNKLGGFASVSQIGETYGLPDSTFQFVKLRMQCNAAAIHRININTAEVSDLKSHPYIRWNIANAIVNYRLQHGNYEKIEDIRKINIVTDDVFNKIAPYLII